MPENEKESNRNNVKDIPNKLASIGYAMVPARGNESPAKFQDDDVEELAKGEHKRWVKEKTDAGWKPSEKTIKERKLHKDLIPWNELPEEEKEKDRVLVRGIPLILTKAGYIMVKIEQ